MTEKEAEDLCRMVRVGVDLSKPNYKYYPETRDELKDLINKLIKERGNEADLNDVDVSKITDMREMFAWSLFNGNISKWDVSKVKDMWGMFRNSQFNGDISNWNVSSVEDMEEMFANSQFNGDISKWNVKEVVNMEKMFANNKSANIPDWCPNESLLRRVLSFLMCRYPDPEKSFWRPLYTVLLFLIGVVVVPVLLEYYL